MTPLSRECVSPYMYFIEDMSVFRTDSETFSIKERHDLEIRTMGSFKVVENGAVR